MNAQRLEILVPTHSEYASSIEPVRSELDRMGVGVSVCGLGKVAAAAWAANLKPEVEHVLVWGTCASLGGQPVGSLCLPSVVSCWDTVLPELVENKIVSPAFCNFAEHYRTFKAGDILWADGEMHSEMADRLRGFGHEAHVGELATADTFATGSDQVHEVRPSAGFVDMETHALLQSLALRKWNGNVSVLRVVSDQVNDASEEHFWAFLEGSFSLMGRDLLVPLLSDML